MNNNFTIVTAVTPEYKDILHWGIGSWGYKPQFRNCPLIVYYNGMREKDLQFTKKVFKDVRLIPWSMEGIESKSELMFSSFVFGAACDVTTKYYMKLDADAYCFSSDDIWSNDDFTFDLVGHKWHYTKPGWFIQKLDNIYNKTNLPIDLNLRHFSHKRIESYCCLHRTEWVKQIANKFNGRLPVPSHDTSLWYYANKEGKWLAKNLKSLGVSNAKNWKCMREIVCSGDTAFNPILDDILISHVQLEITHKCNIGCNQCDRNCGVLPAGEDMAIAQVWKFVEEHIKQERQLNRIDIIGGEPTLHPKLNQVFDLIKIYKNKYPKTKIRFSTNGLGDKVNEALKNIPAWISVRNSSKEGKEAGHTSYRNAPIDNGVTDFKACSVPWRCGIALTRHGYFPCGAGAAVARAFGLDIGLKSLKEVNPATIKKQMIQLCKYCGHSNSIPQDKSTDNSCSVSWKNAIEKYNDKAMGEF